MRRTYFFVGLIVAVTTCIGVVWWTQPGVAQPPKAVPAADGAPKQALPLTQVILFNSGVGYLQREGTIDGDARIDMTVPIKDVNDLLKSVVLEDNDGGKISAVSYDSMEPVENTLRAFALDLTTNPSFADLLDQARGEKVEVKTQGNPNLPPSLSGVIVGMESQVDAGKLAYFLTVLTGEGVRCIPLTSVQTVRFLNPALEADLRHALEVLGHTHDSQKKQVTFHFRGKGKRDVKVGYVVESPMWKANYRLVFDKDGKLKMQGWAVIENTSDDDWNDVRLALVSARPISFKMDQYQPLFVPRPTVEPELYAQLRVPTFSGPLAVRGQAGQIGGLGGIGGIGGLGGLGGGLGGIGQMPPAVANGIGQVGGIGQQNVYAKRLRDPLEVSLDPQTGLPIRPTRDPIIDPETGQLAKSVPFGELQARRVQLQQEREKAKEAGAAIAGPNVKGLLNGPAQGEGDETEDSYQYVLDEKVSISRQKSALMPIIGETVQGKHLSIYNEKNEEKHPLLGLRFKNTTKQPLMQGPVMVFADGRYAGDARLMDMQPNEERLLAYAVDLGVEVVAGAQTGDRAVPNTPMSRTFFENGATHVRTMTAMKLVKGILQQTSKERATKTYLVKNRSKEDRLVVIEHPIISGWKLVSDKPAEAARDFYRFEVPAAAGKLVRFDVVEELVATETNQIFVLNEATLKTFITNDTTSQAMKDAMQKVLDWKAIMLAADREVVNRADQLKAIIDDQTRLRANLASLPKESDAYKRYVAKFDTQETEIEKLQAQIKEKQEAYLLRHKEYMEFAAGLTVD